MTKAYEGLAAAAPVLNDKARRQREKAIEIQQGQALAQAELAPDMNVRRAGQQVGADTVAAKAQAGQEATTAEQGQLSQLAGQAAASDSAAIQKDLALRGQRQRAGLSAEQQAQQLEGAALGEQQANQLSEESLALAKRMQERGINIEDRVAFISAEEQEDLARIARDADEKLFFSRLAFDEKAGKEQFGHEIQALDWAVASAESAEEFQDKIQSIEQSFKKEMVLYEITIKKLEQSLKQEHADSEQALDQASKRKIEKAIAALKVKQARRQRDATILTSVIGAGAKIASAGAS